LDVLISTRRESNTEEKTSQEQTLQQGTPQDATPQGAKVILLKHLKLTTLGRIGGVVLVVVVGTLAVVGIICHYQSKRRTS